MTQLKRKVMRALRQIKARYKLAIDTRAMNRQPVRICHTDALSSVSRAKLNSLFHDPDVDEDWKADEQCLRSVNPPDYSDGVNPGDQRALYYLVRTLKPSRVLEVGTHIGSSTLALALAIKRNQSESDAGEIVTVDIRDVNDETTQPWREFGSDASPWKKLQTLGLEDLVQFKIGDSLQVLSGINQKFELIFLDGNHRAPAMYQEIPLSLDCLATGGSVLLHDYFPNGNPLWKESSPIPGPWQAISRLINESADFQVIPFGDLPWPTKWKTHTTSLAMLSRPGDSRQRTGP